MTPIRRWWWQNGGTMAAQCGTMRHNPAQLWTESAATSPMVNLHIYDMSPNRQCGAGPFFSIVLDTL